MYIILFLIGIILVILNWRAIKKEKTSFKGTMELASLDVKEIDLKVGQVRREFAETITELQREIIDLRQMVEVLQTSTKANTIHVDNEEQNYSNKPQEENLTLKEQELRENITNELKNFNNENAKIEKIEYNESKSNLVHTDEERNHRAMELLQQIESLMPKNNEEEENEASFEVKLENKVPSNNLKVTDVKKLFEEGLALDEIAAKLNMGKGEVLLIKELYLK